MKRWMFGILLVLALTLPALGQSVPSLVNYQGRLTDQTPEQNPIDGSLAMEFRIYGSQTGSDLLWSESWAGVVVTDGIFSVLLGSQGSPIPDDLFNAGQERYLETVVLGEVLAPRHRLASVPFSYAADSLDGYEGVEVEESAEIDADVITHDLDTSAHFNIFFHDHDSEYYTQAELDPIFDWGDWQIAHNAGGDELQFVHPDGAAQPAPVMTLQPPTSSANVGIGTTTPAEKLEVAGAIKIGNTAGTEEGSIRYTGTDFEGRIGDAWTTLSSTEVAKANVKTFGAVGDSVTDDTVAVQAAIDSLAGTGGVVFFPEGRYLILGQIALPNDGGDPLVYQEPIKFEGVGAYFEPRTELSVLPHGGSILDLRYSPGPKIVTYGAGLFETDGITFANFNINLNNGSFIYTTNTTLHIHNCAFYGLPPGIDPGVDAIVLGGTSSATPGDLDPNGPFQGYGTVIRDNFFSRIRRAAYGRVFANGVVFVNNTVWSSCGTNLPEGAAIEIDGDPDGLSAQAASGWYIAGNLIEMVFYPYGIKLRESQRNALIANNFFDPSELSQAYYLFEESGKLNYVLAGFHDDTKLFVEDRATGNARSTVIDFHQNRESSFAQKVRFVNKVYMETGNDAPSGPRIVSPSGAELSYQFIGDNSMMVNYTLEGGSPVPLWQIKDFGGGVVVQELQGTDARIRGVNGPVRLQSPVGSLLELGDTAGKGITIDDGRVRFSATAVTMFSGAGVPAMSAPNGSIYLRSDGEVGSTFYVREGDSWVAK